MRSGVDAQFLAQAFLEVLVRGQGIGLPATGEFALIFITTAVAYWSIRGFGPAAQAGYGIGARVMQAIFLPAMAVAFATGPIAGQNFGARHAQRLLRDMSVFAADFTADAAAAVADDSLDSIAVRGGLG